MVEKFQNQIHCTYIYHLYYVKTDTYYSLLESNCHLICCMILGWIVVYVTNIVIDNVFNVWFPTK